MAYETTDFALLTWSKLQPPAWQQSLKNWFCWLLDDTTEEAAW